VGSPGNKRRLHTRGLTGEARQGYAVGQRVTAADEIRIRLRLPIGCGQHGLHLLNEFGDGHFDTAQTLAFRQLGVRVPAFRQQSVILQATGNAEEARGQLALWVLRQFLVDLHLILARDLLKGYCLGIWQF